MFSIKVKANLSGGITKLRILVQHPMETGRRRDPDTGSIVPAHYIERLIVAHNGRVIIATRLSTAVSRNPHLSFEFRGGAVGDNINVSWQDNRGRSDQQDTLIRTSDT